MAMLDFKTEPSHLGGIHMSLYPKRIRLTFSTYVVLCTIAHTYVKPGSCKQIVWYKFQVQCRQKSILNRK